MYLPLIDDFTRANETPLSGGGRWAVFGPYAQAILTSNAASGNSGENASRYVPLIAGPNAGISFRVASGATALIGKLALAIQDGSLSTFDGYIFTVTNAEGNECSLLRFDNGTATQLKIRFFSGSFVNNGDEVFLHYINGILYAGVATQVLLTVADSNYNIPGQVAMGCGIGASIDDARAGTIQSEIVVPSIEGMRMGT